jgi:hypothetical protein
MNYLYINRSAKIVIIKRKSAMRNKLPNFELDIKFLLLREQMNDKTMNEKQKAVLKKHHKKMEQISKTEV